MSKRKDNTTYMGLNINKLKLIGQGHQGKVYLLPENKVINIKDEYPNYYNSWSNKIS